MTKEQYYKKIVKWEWKDEDYWGGFIFGIYLVLLSISGTGYNLFFSEGNKISYLLFLMIFVASFMFLIIPNLPSRKVLWRKI